MYFSQMDADLAALAALDDSLDGIVSHLDEALGVVEEVCSIGLTKDNFAQLKQYCPDLKDVEFELSSMPVLLGTESVGNEAAGGLSVLAISGILGIIGTAIAWIISKVFGGGSSGGSGGGGGASSGGGLGKGFGGGTAKEMAKLKIGLNTKDVTDLYKALADHKGTSESDRNKYLEQMRQAAWVATIYGDINSGAISASLAASNDILKLVTEMAKNAFDVNSSTKTLGATIPAQYGTVVSGISYIPSDRKSKLVIPKATTPEEIVKAMKAAEAFHRDNTGLDMKTGECGKSTAQIEIRETNLNKIQQDFGKVYKEIKNNENILKNKGNVAPASNTKELLVAATYSCNIVARFLRNCIITPISNTSMFTSELYKIIRGSISLAIEAVDALGTDDRKKFLDSAGFSEDDLKKMKESLKKNEVAGYEDAAVLLNKIYDHTNLDDSVKTKIDAKSSHKHIK